MKDFVNYNQALALKELGFTLDRREVLRFISTSGTLYEFSMSEFIIAPTFSQAFRFLREKYDIHYSIDRECSQHDGKWGYNWTIYNYNKVVKTDEEYITSHPNAPSGEWIYSSYEDAEIEVLDKLIEIAKSKTNENQL